MTPAGWTIQGSVAVVLFGEPPVNSLGHATRVALVVGLERAAKDRAVRAVVLAGNGDLFSGGADIREFGTALVAEAPTLHDILAWLDASAKPVVAAIGGTCLGGGLELALACHHRVAAAKASIGFPEVKLGLLPGAGGTQRLPRLVGVATALKMIVGGDPLPATALAATGLLDRVVDADVVGAAVALARAVGERSAAPRRTRDLAVNEPNLAALCDAARTRARQAAPHYPAPLACIDAIEAAAKPWEEGSRTERALFLELLDSPESKALRHAFFAERAAAKIDDLPVGTKTRPIGQAAVVGAGTMGSGITMCFLNAGIPVRLLEADQAALDRGVARIRETYDSRLERGKLTPKEHAQRLALLDPTLRYSELGAADIVIEAVFEDMQIKENVFAKLDAAMKAGAILATNTSTLDIDRLAQVTRRPHDVIGTHFFSPAHVMQLLEVVRGAATAPDVLATVMKLAKTLKKVAVVSGVCDGFIGNRMLHQYFRQAGYLVEEGASPQQIDTTIEAFGMAMGPFRMGDLAGNDVGWLIRKRRYAESPDFEYPRIGDKLCELGRFGQKTQAGWYDYKPGDRTAYPSRVVDELIVEHRASLGLKPRAIDDREIVDRLVYALVNEAALILEEGIAARASDIDVVYLTGYGFPPWRGGPLFYADQVGLRKVVARIKELAANPHGAPEFWMPAPLLERLAASGGSFNAGGQSA
jgi:3-hydroxyacyl-CoA dehydrogenase